MMYAKCMFVHKKYQMYAYEHLEVLHMLAIKNATLVMKNHLIPEAVLLVEDGVIKDFGPARKMAIPADAEVIDAEGNFVGPGFIDIHTHCGGNTLFDEDPVTASRGHLLKGTTTVLPTLYFSMNTQEFVDSINKLKEAMKNPECGNIGGLYMEGPYMNPKFGADRENNPWQGPICKDDYMPILEAAGDLVRVWGVAPEREHILDFVFLILLVVEHLNQKLIYSHYFLLLLLHTISVNSFQMLD